MALNMLLNCSTFNALSFDMLNENKRKEEGKDQESIQSSPTPDPRYHMGK